MPLSRSLAPAAYAALALADTALAASPSPTTRRFRMVTKPLLMPALGTAFALSLTERDADRVDSGGVLAGGTVAAQAMSGLGDMALLGSSEPAFLTGLSSFFGAHVAYTAAFASAGRPITDPTGWRGAAAAGAVFAIAAPLMGWAAGRKNPHLRGPVLAYAGILSSMVAASTRLEPTLPASARRKVVMGTALFLASDGILGLREFVLPDRSPLADAAVMATYTTGQGLIAAGVSEAVRSRAEAR